MLSIFVAMAPATIKASTFRRSTKANRLIKKIFHLHILKTDEHRYYTSLKALFDESGKLVDKSKFWFDRYDFIKPYTNEQIIIRKGHAYGTGDIKSNLKPATKKTAAKKSKS